MWEYNETDNLPGTSLYHSADECDSYYVVNIDTEDIVKWSPAYDLEGYLNIIKNNLFKSI